MTFDQLVTGTKLELQAFDKNGVKIDHTLISQFETIYDDESALIAAPLLERVVYPLHLDTVINVYFIVKNANEMELYYFKAQVAERLIHDNIPMLKVRIKSKIERIQRRKYYRLLCSVSVKYRVVEDYNKEHNDEIPFIKTIAINLSGGGICILLEEKIGVGKILECEITTLKNRTVNFYGKVVRYNRNENESRYKFQASIAFIKITNKEREAVVRFIFDEQRKLRKKGLI